jgi:hypothetical protein
VLFRVWNRNVQEFYENAQELNHDVKGFKTTTQRELWGYSMHCCGHRLQICTTGLVVLDDNLQRGRNTLVEFIS